MTSYLGLPLSQFIRSDCCDEPVVQLDDFACMVKVTRCSACGKCAGAATYQDLDRLELMAAS